MSPLRITRPALLLALAAAASAQTVPFSVEVVDVPTAQAPALHSAAYGRDGGRWLFVTGRTNGLHGLTAQPDPFPAEFANGAVVVYELATDTRWTASLDELPAAVAAPLRSTNAQFWQRGPTLFVIGGYGRDETGVNVTFPVLTAIDVPGIIEAVHDGTALAPHVRRLVDQRLAVAGGHMVLRGDHFQLIGGNRFDGDYMGPGMIQTYTEAVRSFMITEDGGVLDIADYSEDVDAVNLHRRDLNVAPVILPGGQESYSLYGGVFNNFNLPFRTPIQIDLGSHTTGTFEARFGHYTCPVLPLHDARDDAMHTVFFGGMGQYWFEEAAGQIREDNLVPFIDDIAALTRASDGTVTEQVLGARMPGYFGSNSQLFVEPTAPAWPNGVLRLESLPGRTLVGYIHGGITTDRPHPGWTLGPSEASNRVFAIYVTPQPLATDDGPSAAGLALSAPLPNPAVRTARVTVTLARAAEVRVDAFDAVGRLVATLHDGLLSQGDHLLELDASSLAPGVYMVRAAGAAGAVTRRVAVSR